MYSMNHVVNDTFLDPSLLPIGLEDHENQGSQIMDSHVDLNVSSPKTPENWQEMSYSNYPKAEILGYHEQVFRACVDDIQSDSSIHKTQSPITTLNTTTSVSTKSTFPHQTYPSQTYQGASGFDSRYPAESINSFKYKDLPPRVSPIHLGSKTIAQHDKTPVQNLLLHQGTSALNISPTPQGNNSSSIDRHSLHHKSQVIDPKLILNDIRAELDGIENGSDPKTRTAIKKVRELLLLFEPARENVIIGDPESQNIIQPQDNEQCSSSSLFLLVSKGKTPDPNKDTNSDIITMGEETPASHNSPQPLDPEYDIHLTHQLHTTESGLGIGPMPPKDGADQPGQCNGSQNVTQFSGNSICAETRSLGGAKRLTGARAKHSPYPQTAPTYKLSTLDSRKAYPEVFNTVQYMKTTVFICKYQCKKGKSAQFTSRQDAEYHLSQLHPDIKDFNMVFKSKEAFRCPYSSCEHLLLEQRRADDHYLENHSEVQPLFKCPKVSCGKTFKVPRYFQDHYRKEFGVPLPVVSNDVT